MDKDGIKAAIQDELGRKVAMSGGPEVFRRLVRGKPEQVEAALQDLVQEGVLSETRLRVGRIYHYPANKAVRLEVLAGFMKKMGEAPARPARPAHGAAPAARDPNAPRPARPAAPRSAVADDDAPADAAVDAPAEPRPATPRSASQPLEAPPAPAFVAGSGETVEASEATAAPAASKQPWVPKKATPRDPNKPRPAPRTPPPPPQEPASDE